MDVVLKSITGRVRNRDEDSVFFADSSYAGQGRAHERTILALADGMGGGGAGDVASGMLIEAVRKHVVPLIFLDSLDDQKVADSIQAAVSDANRTIRDYASEKGIETMGTTAVVALVEGGKITVGNIGDSRLYVANDNGLSQVTKDHSLVQLLYEKGEITKDQMRKHPKKNLITKAVGLEETITADITESRIFKGDRILLCCDGLWESMPEADIGVLAMEPDIRKAVERLVEDANTLDGTDNISVVLAVPILTCGREEFAKEVTKTIVPAQASEGSP